MNRSLFITLLAVLATSALAEENQSQWKISNLSMFDLVQAGYRVMSVSSEPPVESQDGGTSTEYFFLQKDTDFFKCNEIHITVRRPVKFSSFYGCWQLTKLYDIHHPTAKP